jgi:hypothetical protein
MAEAVAAPAEVAKPAIPVGTPPAATETAPEAPRVYSQAEVDEITKKVRKNTEYRTKKEQEAYWRGRTEAPRQAPEAPKPPPEDKEPARDDFADYTDYAAKHAAWVARTETAAQFEKRDKEAAARAKAEAQAKRNQEFQAKAKAKYADFEERLASIGDMPMHAEVYEAIADSSVGHDILIHFADSPSDYERIAGLPPSAQIREIGKLEARFEAAATKSDEPKTPEASAAVPSAPAAPVSRAPAPITPLKGGGTPPTNVIKDGMSFDEFRRVRNRQLGRVK